MSEKKTFADSALDAAREVRYNHTRGTDEEDNGLPRKDAYIDADTERVVEWKE
jgi:hypothetical protein